MKIIIGPTNSGKTNRLLEMASEWADDGKKVVIVSNEIVPSHFIKRMYDLNIHMDLEHVQFIHVPIDNSIAETLGLVTNTEADVIMLDLIPTIHPTKTKWESLKRDNELILAFGKYLEVPIYVTAQAKLDTSLRGLMVVEYGDSETTLKGNMGGLE